MAQILNGAPVAAALNEKTRTAVRRLRENGVVPTLAIVRVGERADDLSYERSAAKRAAELDAEVRRCALPADISPDIFEAELGKLCRDDSVHGILLMRPLPRHLDEAAACRMLPPEKDVDGCSEASFAGVFMNSGVGFAPCTAQAAMEMLDYYSIPCTGKRAAVVGRSLVVGRPAAMLLMHRNATVTVCHTRTKDVPAVTREAEIVIAATGQMEGIDGTYFAPDAVVLDVGIHWNEKTGKLCGDVDFADAEPAVRAITPVPGGVGSVTTAVLFSHVVQSAERKCGQ